MFCCGRVIIKLGLPGFGSYNRGFSGVRVSQSNSHSASHSQSLSNRIVMHFFQLSAAISVFICVILIRALLSLKSRQPKGTRRLPGPKGIIYSSWGFRVSSQGQITHSILGKPFIGSNLGKDYFWFKFDEWAQQYGSIYQYKSFRQVNIVVSTEGIANELLRERGTIYSSREQLPMASQLLSDNKRALFLPYDGAYCIPNGIHKLTYFRRVAQSPQIPTPGHNAKGCHLLPAATTPGIGPSRPRHHSGPQKISDALSTLCIRTHSSPDLRCENRNRRRRDGPPGLQEPNECRTSCSARPVSCGRTSHLDVDSKMACPF